MRSKISGMEVDFISHSVGVVSKGGNNEFRVGYRSTTWVMENFSPIKGVNDVPQVPSNGTITLHDSQKYVLRVADISGLCNQGSYGISIQLEGTVHTLCYEKDTSTRDSDYNKIKAAMCSL